MRIVSLAVGLFVFWLLLSGHFDSFLIVAGAAAAVLIALAGWGFGYADEEGVPLEFTFGAALYWPWLVKEIIKSALDVARIILDPALPIAPRLLRVRPSQKSAVGTVAYANSITLTPDPQYVVTNLVRDVLMPTNLFANWSTSLDGQTINFFGGSVPVGQQLVAMFDFDITDISGQFSYHIANLPHSASAPEPTSLAMVGLGAALLLRRRR